MNSKKVLSTIISIILMITPTLSFADDLLEENSFFNDIGIEASSSLSEIPNINSKNSVILDRASKTILFGKNENEKCKMASTTKIMTAIVVIENCSNLNETVTISKKAARNRWF